MKNFTLALSLLISTLPAFALNLRQFTGSFELVSGNCPNQIKIYTHNRINLIVEDSVAPKYEAHYLYFGKVNKGMQSWITPPDYDEQDRQRFDFGTYKRKSCFKSVLKKNELNHHIQHFLGVYKMCLFADLEIGQTLQIADSTLNLYKYGSKCIYQKVSW